MVKAICYVPSLGNILLVLLRLLLNQIDPWRTAFGSFLDARLEVGNKQGSVTTMMAMMAMMYNYSYAYPHILTTHTASFSYVEEEKLLILA